MADYFTKLSLAVKMTAEEAAWITRVHEAVRSRLFNENPDGEPMPVEPDIADVVAELAEGCESAAVILEFDTNALWLHDDENANVEYTARLIQAHLAHAGSEDIVTFEWSNDCSRARLDAYGGGGCIVTAEAIHYMTTATWVQEKVDEIVEARTVPPEGQVP